MVSVVTVTTREIPTFDGNTHCHIDRFDAATRINGELFMFKGTQFWRSGDTAGHAFSITDIWETLDDFTRLDAVYETPEKEIWVFIGKDIHIFNGTSVQTGEKKLEDLGIDKDKVDAIFQNPEDQQTYIFSGKFQWKLEGLKLSPAAKINRDWKNVIGMDAAFRDGSDLIFFKGANYYVFDSDTKSIDLESPHSIVPKYFHCGKVTGKKPPNSAGAKQSGVFLIASLFMLSICSN